MSDLAAILQQKQQAAGTTPVAAAPVVAAQPVVAPVAPVAQPAVVPVATPAPATAVAQPAAAPLGGGSQLASIMDALKTATTGNKRNDLAIGTGTYLLKDVKYKVTDDGKWRISTIFLLCLEGVVDGNGIAIGSQGYSGPIPGETYEQGIFHDYSPKKVARTMKTNLAILEAVMGWTKEQRKAYQDDPSGQGMTYLSQLLAGLFCVSLDGVATQQASVFANQVAMQISVKVSQYEKKVGDTVVYTKEGDVVMQTSINKYWDKKVRLKDVWERIGQEGCVRAFGSLELFTAAYQTEEAMFAQSV